MSNELVCNEGVLVNLIPMCADAYNEKLKMRLWDLHVKNLDYLPDRIGIYNQNLTKHVYALFQLISITFLIFLNTKISLYIHICINIIKCFLSMYIVSYFCITYIYVSVYVKNVARIYKSTRRKQFCIHT